MLGAPETIAVVTFALSTLGLLVRLSIQAGRVLARLEDHEHRLRRLEGRHPVQKVVVR